jgi:hypothetical protein
MNTPGYWVITEADTPFRMSSLNTSYGDTQPRPADLAADLPLWVESLDGEPSLTPIHWGESEAFAVTGTVDGEPVEWVAIWAVEVSA